MEWINVDKDRPENLQEILMTYNDFVMEGQYANGKFYYPSNCSHVIGFCQCEEQEAITHWMPLPKPPKD